MQQTEATRAPRAENYVPHSEFEVYIATTTSCSEVLPHVLKYYLML